MAGAIVMLTGAGLPNPRSFTARDARERIEAIASRPRGWFVHTLLFPLGFALVAAGGGASVQALKRDDARRLGTLGAALSALAALLWVPISVQRLRVWKHIDDRVGEGNADIGRFDFLAVHGQRPAWHLGHCFCARS